MGVGSNIKAVLKEKNMSIKELSKITGISLNTLYSITKRDSTRVDTEILVKIKDALGVSGGYLLTGSTRGLAYDQADVGARMKSAREAAGVSIDEAAAVIGAPADVYDNVEEGKNIFNVDDMKKLAQRFGVELMDLTGPPQPLDLTQYDALRENQLLDSFNKLNGKGKDKAVADVQLLTEIPRYLKK
ncbi:helix-turn-helix domain-containing protein [Ruminococcaceae bacterium OttesenSCG-928-D13]|nr:helix-turn-helix domain-containing protein [Ruminococcaceae bacterium OttesenSCG-928-D13]